MRRCSLGFNLGGVVRFEGRVGLERDAHVVLHVRARRVLPDLVRRELRGIDLGGWKRGFSSRGGGGHEVLHCKDLSGHLGLFRSNDRHEAEA